MYFSIISKNIGKRKTYYYLKDKNNNKYFGKKFMYSQDKMKLIHEIDMLKYFSDYDFVPKIRYTDLENNIIIYDYIDGKTLKNKIMDIDGTIKIILAICDILEVIHNLGYIFGDIKPSNIMLGDRIFLIDYECVTKIGESLNYASMLYCSPYQRFNKTAIFQFDLFSLGVVFLELLIGFDKVKYLFDRNEITKIQPNKIILNLPNEINNIIKKLLSISVQDNYNNILELKQDLQDYLEKGV